MSPGPHCTSQHPTTNTQELYYWSVSCLCWYQHIADSNTVSVDHLSLHIGGIVDFCGAVSVGSIHIACHVIVPAHLPNCLRRQSSQQITNCSLSAFTISFQAVFFSEHEWASRTWTLLIYGTTRDHYMDLGNQGATNAGKNIGYIHTWAIVTINVGLAQAHPNNTLNYISAYHITSRQSDHSKRVACWCVKVTGYRLHGHAALCT